MSNVLVVAEIASNTLRPVTLTAISFAREAAKRLGCTVDAVAIGHNIRGAADELAKYVANVHLADDPALAHPLAETHAKAIAAATKAAGASVVCMAASAYGKDVLPRAAALLDAGMASDVVAFAGENGLGLVRPIQAGNVLATVEITTAVRVVSTRPTEFSPAAPAASAGAVQPITTDLSGTKTRFVKFDKIASTRPDLADARVVVSGGRGLKEGANFAKLIDHRRQTESSGRREPAVVDAGWVPNDIQVGQTGKVVAPELIATESPAPSTRRRNEGVEDDRRDQQGRRSTDLPGGRLRSSPILQGSPEPRKLG